MAHHLLAKCYTSILCLKAFANSHTKISILAFPRLKVLLTNNFWLEIKNSCTILALFHKIQLWSSKRTLRYIGEIKSTITRLFLRYVIFKVALFQQALLKTQSLTTASFCHPPATALSRFGLMHPVWAAGLQKDTSRFLKIAFVKLGGCRD